MLWEKEKLLVSTFHHFCQIQNFCLQTLSGWENLKFVIWESVETSGDVDSKYSAMSVLNREISVCIREISVYQKISC